MPVADAEIAELTRQCLGAIPAWHAARRPDALAVHYAGARMSFATLEERAERVARALAAAGLERGDRIAVVDRNAASFVELLFGAAKAGICLVALNFRLAPPELQFQLEDSDARLLFAGTEFAPAARAMTLPLLRRIIVLESEYEAWRDDGGADYEPARRDDTLLQMYTSGTTGRPKGVELTHANMMLTLAESRPLWPYLGPDAPALTAMPLFHVGGLNFVTTPLCFGAGVVLLRDADPLTIARAAAEHRAVLAPLPPVLIQAILDLPLRATLDLSSLKVILVAGSAIPLDILVRGVRELGCGFAQGYGMTETCGGLAYLPPEDMTPEGSERMKAGGKPFGAAEIRVVDAADHDVPQGQVGEIICRSPRVMKGYWKRPEATAEALRGGWLHTGDAGFFDADGYLHIVDRIKDMVISGGENIYPAEIELALAGHPDVQECAVIGVPDERWGEAVLAVVAPRAGAQPSEESLVAFLRTRLAGYKIPRRYEFRATLPRNATGKVTKWALREPYWRGQERQVR